jgi:hypothetical protein
MSELTHQFVQCSHCKQRWPGLRYTCPYCNWPREHTDETPAPTSGMADQTKVIPTAPEQTAPAATPYTTSVEGSLPDPILVVPVPQAPKLDPDAVQQLDMGAMQAAALRAPARGPQIITLAPDDPVPEPSPAPTLGTGATAKSLYQPDAGEMGKLPLDAFDAPKPRSKKK